MKDDLVPFSQDVLRALTDEADRAAVENIRKKRGGPFGACLYVAGLAGISPAGAPTANAVLAKGLASAHGEDQAMSPAHVARLREMLAETGPEESYVILASSAEPCPACHAKAEILARILMADGLIKPGRFIVAFGATYQDTQEIAGFNDAPYHEDMMRAENKRLIKMKRVMLEQNEAAVIELPDGQVFAGRDGRESHFTLTPEINAIRAAAASQKKNGVAEPQDLRGAALYTLSASVGPLVYAECQWANVTSIFHAADGLENSEAPDVSNDDLFQAVARRPYNGAGTAVVVVPVTGFANRAQHEWRRLLAEGNAGMIFYNGIDTGAA